MHKKIKINNLNISYHKEGTGPFLLLLHGWGKSAAVFTKLSQNLAKNYTVVSLDLPGFGHSSLPPEAWGIKEYSQLVAEFCHQIGWNQFSIIGHSFGGRIAIQMAADRNILIKELVLTGVPILRYKNYRRLFLLIIAKLAKILTLLPPFCLLESQLRRFFYFLIGEHDYYQSKGIMKRVLKRVINQDQVKLLSQIKIPTLIIWGGADRVTLVEQAFFLKEKLINSQLNIIQQGSHKLPYEKEKLFTREVISFLKKVNDV